MASIYFFFVNQNIKIKYKFYINLYHSHNHIINPKNHNNKLHLIRYSRARVHESSSVSLITSK